MKCNECPYMKYNIFCYTSYLCTCYSCDLTDVTPTTDCPLGNPPQIDEP